MHDEALGRSSGHDGARSLLHGSSELHDLGVPLLVRNVSLSVLGDVLLGGGSPCGDGSNVGHALVVEGDGLEFTSGLAFLVSSDLGTTGVSGSAPELNNLTLRNESLGGGLLVSEFVKEVLGTLAHFGVEHVSLHGSRKSDVADQLGVESGSLLSSNDNFGSSVDSEVGSLVSFDSVLDVQVSGDNSNGTLLLMMTDNSISNLFGVGTSGGVSLADVESLSSLNSGVLERVSSLVDEVTSHLLGLLGDSLLTGNLFGSNSEVSSGKLGVVSEHASLEHNLTFVFFLGDLESEESFVGLHLEVDSLDLVLLGEDEVDSNLLLLNLGGSQSTDSSSVVVSSFHVKSSLLFLKSYGNGAVVDSLDLEASSNSLEVNNSLDKFGVHELGVVHDTSLVLVDGIEFNLKSLLVMSHGVVLSSELFLFGSECNSNGVLVFVDSGHLFSLNSEGDLELFESNGLKVGGISSGMSFNRFFADLDSVVHDMNGLLGSLDEFSLESSSDMAFGVLNLVDTSPVVDLLSHSGDHLFGVLVSMSKLHPDGLHVLLLNNVEVEGDGSMVELGLEHGDLNMSSLLSSFSGSVLEGLDLNGKLNLDLHHGLLSMSHLDEHGFLGVVSLVGLNNPVLGFLHQFDSSLDGMVSFVFSVFACNNGETVSFDGHFLLVLCLHQSDVSEFVLSLHLQEVSLHLISMDNSFFHGDMSESHSSSGLSSDSSVVDHEGVGLNGSLMSVLHFFKSNSLKLEGMEVFMVSNLGSFLGLHSKVGCLDNLDVPGVDNELILGHRFLGVGLSDELMLEGKLSGGSGFHKLDEGKLESELSSKSHLVHFLSSLLTTDSLSVVVEGFLFSRLAEFSLSGEAFLGSNFDLEVNSHHSGSSG